MISSVLSKQFGRLPTRALLTRCSSGRIVAQSHRTTASIAQRHFSVAADAEPKATEQARELLAEFARDRFSAKKLRHKKLSGFLQSLNTRGDLSLIKESLKYAKKNGLELTPEITAEMLDACLRFPEVGLDIAFDVLRSPRNAGPDAPVIQTGADTVRRLMRALQAEERHVDALDVFLAYDEVMSFPLGVYDEMFRTALAGEDLHLAAIHEFEYIREHGPMPDARTYSIITETALKQEEYEYALKILELYEKDGFKMDEHFVKLKQEAQEGMKRQEAHKH